MAEEAERATRLRRNREIRLAKAIVLKRGRTLKQIQGRIHEFIYEYSDLSSDAKQPDDEYTRILAELNGLAKGVDPPLSMFTARRLASLSPSKALDLACKHIWLLTVRIPCSHRFGFERHLDG
jgi:hypothetical protein